MNPLFTFLRDQAYGLWSSVRSAEDPAAFLPLLRPVAPYDTGPVLSPVTMLGVVLALALSSGVALMALGVLLLALLVIYLLFTEVLGISIEVRPL